MKRLTLSTFLLLLLAFGAITSAQTPTPPFWLPTPDANFVESTLSPYQVELQEHLECALLCVESVEGEWIGHGFLWEAAHSLVLMDDLLNVFFSAIIVIYAIVRAFLFWEMWQGGLIRRVRRGGGDDE